MLEKIKDASSFLTSRIDESPKIGMITGTGLGILTEIIDVDFRVSYEEIPHFSRSTIEGHNGTMVTGRLGGKPIIAMEGRFHLYEGYSPEEIAFPVRVMASMGIETLLISSAAGGLNPEFETGDLMMITDHINLTGRNPLSGPNLDELGARFPDMSQAYDKELIKLAREKALASSIHLKQGVYAGILGPSLETPAETRFLRMIGADAVGMSTVTEVIAGVHLGLNIMSIIIITNMNLPDCMSPASLDEIIASARKSADKLAGLWERIISDLP